MDLRALEYTRAHYDRHSNQYASTEEALRARAQGPGAPLKKFHNDIKRQLISRFAGGAGSLLDFACGRGGDIWKWIDAGISRVKGIDLSPGEIEEARKRFEEARDKRPEMELDYEFMDSPLLGVSEWREDQQYDVVTCMFAIHYFFVTEAALKQFLHNVSINLKEGGYFIGTVPDGKRVNECIKTGKTFKSPMLTIEARWEGQPSCFGSPYICAIGDTVTGGEKGTEGSLEYLVYTNALVGVAAQFGLKPVLDYGDPNLASLFESADAGKPLKHFRPRFPNSDRSLEWASRLFAAFVFQKTSSTPAAPGVDPDRRAQLAAAAAARLKRPLESAAAPAAGAVTGAAAAGTAPPPPKRRRPGLLQSVAAPQQEQQAQQQAQQAQQQQQQQQQQQSGEDGGAASEQQQEEQHSGEAGAEQQQEGSEQPQSEEQGSEEEEEQQDADEDI